MFGACDSPLYVKVSWRRREKSLCIPASEDSKKLYKMKKKNELEKVRSFAKQYQFDGKLIREI